MGIKPNQKARCPHCRTTVRFEQVAFQLDGQNFGARATVTLTTPSNHRLYLAVAGCPDCGRVVISTVAAGEPGQSDTSSDIQLWPDSANRPLASEVEAEAPSLANDFREAVAVFAKSKKASAALSRRCLQFVLVHKGAATEKDLAKQIDQVLPTLPSDLAANVDAVRHVGNFAAHPMKSQQTGDIVDVEEGEAEWLLDVLEGLFDFYYVAPAQAASKRAALNAKLASLGKPPLKGT